MVIAGPLPMIEYRPMRSPPSTLSSRKALPSPRSFRNVEIGVSRSAANSHETGIRLPPRVRLRKSGFVGSMSSTVVIASPAALVAAPQQSLQRLLAVQRAFQPVQLLPEPPQRLLDGPAVAPADLQPQVHRTA